MSLVHLHLALTHVPVLAVVFGTLLLLATLPRRNEVLRRTALAVLSLSGLIRYRRGKPIRGQFATLVLLASLAVSGVMLWTANLGGQIRHTEIRAGAQAGSPAPAAASD